MSDGEQVAETSAGDATPASPFSPSLKLTSYKLDPFLQRASLLLNLREVEHSVEFVDLAHKPELFERISPLGKVPVLEVSDEEGTMHCLWEPHAIMEYLDSLHSPGFLLENPLKRAKDSMFIELFNSLGPELWNYIGQPNEENKRAIKEDLHKKLALLDSRIVGPFFHGGSLTMLDLAAAPFLVTLKLLSSYDHSLELEGLDKLKTLQNAFLEGGQYGDVFQRSTCPDYAQVLRETLERSCKWLFDKPAASEEGSSSTTAS